MQINLFLHVHLCGTTIAAKVVVEYARSIAIAAAVIRTGRFGNAVVVCTCLAESRFLQVNGLPLDSLKDKEYQKACRVTHTKLNMLLPGKHSERM